MFPQLPYISPAWDVFDLGCDQPPRVLLLKTFLYTSNIWHLDQCPSHNPGNARTWISLRTKKWPIELYKKGCGLRERDVPAASMTIRHIDLVSIHHESYLCHLDHLGLKNCRICACEGVPTASQAPEPFSEFTNNVVFRLLPDHESWGIVYARTVQLPHGSHLLSWKDCWPEPPLLLFPIYRFIVTCSIPWPLPSGTLVQVPTSTCTSVPEGRERCN